MHINIYTHTHTRIDILVVIAGVVEPRAHDVRADAAVLGEPGLAVGDGVEDAHARAAEVAAVIGQGAAGVGGIEARGGVGAERARR